MNEGTLKIQGARFILTVDPDRRIIENGSILVRGNRIVQIGKSETMADVPANRTIDAREMAARAAQSTAGTLYKARIHIEGDPVMNIDGHEIQLTPGMAVTVNIKTGKRTIMDFLLSTMWRYTDESMTER